MNLANVATELANALDQIPRVNVLDHIPPKITPPCAFVAMGEGDFLEDYGGGQRVDWEIAVIVSRANVKGAQDAIRGFAAVDQGQDPRSIKAAVEADPTLNGEVSSCVVQRWDEPERVEVAGNEYVQLVFHVEAID